MSQKCYTVMLFLPFSSCEISKILAVISAVKKCVTPGRLGLVENMWFYPLNVACLCPCRVSVGVPSHLCKLGSSGSRIGVEREEPGCDGTNQRGVAMCFLQTEGQAFGE